MLLLLQCVRFVNKTCILNVSFKLVSNHSLDIYAEWRHTQQEASFFHCCVVATQLHNQRNTLEKTDDV